MSLFALQLTLEYVNCPKGGISFSSRIRKLQSRLEMQTRELKQWQKRAKSEEGMRRQAELKINELQGIIEDAHTDKERLVINIQE
jgi:predicted Holliday junction resolvase-like endonuclease